MNEVAEAPQCSEVTAAADDASALVEYLRDRDEPCPLCRYNLRGLTGARCPECGRALRLSVGLVEPLLGPWLLAAVPLIGCAGLGVFGVFGLAKSGWPDHGEPIGLKIALVMFMGSIPLALAAVMQRRRFLQLPRRRQGVLGALASGYAAASFAFIIVPLLSQ
jgi:hypothetical protein